HGVSPLVACSWLGCFIVAIVLSAMIATYRVKNRQAIFLGLFVLSIIVTLKFDFKMIGEFYLEAASQGSNALAASVMENRPLIYAGMRDIAWWGTGFFFLTPLILIVLLKLRKQGDLLVAAALFSMQILTLVNERCSLLLTLPLSLGSAIIAKKGLEFG